MSLYNHLHFVICVFTKAYLVYLMIYRSTRFLILIALNLLIVLTCWLISYLACIGCMYLSVAVLIMKLNLIITVA